MASEGPISVSDTLSVDDQRGLDDLFDQHNVEHTGIRDARLLSITLRSVDGEVYAGLYGHTWGGCCELKTIWVAEDRRRQGAGGRLLEAAENEAARRGCTQIVLTTHSFQAPEFYENRDFRRIASVDDYPKGHSHILMVKCIAG